MLVMTVVFGTAILVPCHTVPLGNETGLALDCRSGGATATGKTFGNSVSICFKSFTVQLPPHGRNKEVVRSFVSAFISPMVFIHVMLNGFAILDLFVKQSLQHTSLGV